MSNIPVFRSNGNYFGFISNENLFNANGKYLGWVENNGQIRGVDGSFMGEIFNDNYIFKRQNMIEPIRQVSKVRPISPVPPVSSINRIGLIMPIGWKDALDDY
jgi:hypothetical protein